nr:IgGFc-binding protein isoform X2 [Anas platyrhynchos]
MAMGRMWWLPAWLSLMCGLSTATFRGKEFLVAFPQNNEEATRPNIKLFFTSYFESTQVTVTTDDDTFSNAVTLRKDQTFSFYVPGTLELVRSRVSQKSLLIKSTKDISVLFTSSKPYSIGAAAVLPLEKLGTEYYVVTPDDSSKDGSKEFVVVAGKAATSVSISFKGSVYFRGMTYPSGSLLRLSLDPYHSLQLQSTDDLSGTKITSDNAVAVFSGHTCVKMRTDCDYVVEQLLPVAAWGNAYIVPPNPLQKVHDYVYVVAAEKTSISYHLGDSASRKDILAGEVYRFETSQNSPFYVSSLAAIQVVFFFTGAKKGSLRQDPFLLNIPPISSYCPSYWVNGLNDHKNYALIVAKNTDTHSITANQKTLKGSWEEVPGSDFSWTMLSISKSFEIQSAEHHPATFGLLVFGFSSYRGFGFTGLCATPTHPTLSCADVICQEQERCKMVEGVPTCIQETFSTCRVTGDPHYLTFDGKTFDFMGTCTYTMTKTCDEDPDLPVFSVKAKNEHRGNPKVSYVGVVIVHVYDITITVVRSEDGFVRVNNQYSRLPISLAQGKLQLQQKGRSVLIKTDFLLKVLYDWDDHLVVKIPSALANKVCGMCGNSNGNPQDDVLLPNGDTAQNTEDLGWGWKVLDESSACFDNCIGECKRCPRDEAKKYKVEALCGLLSQSSGPFQRCHAVINPKNYLDNCVYDLCVNDGLHNKLCQALKAYADDCREEGVIVDDWRTPARCPLSCPENSNYTSCGSTCPATCNNAAMPADCGASTCVETCECQEGFVLDAGKCIPQAECGCVFEGRLYGLGEEFWGDNTCTKRCVCDAATRTAVCRKASCRAREECRVEQGIQDCYPTSYGNCTAYGTTHYKDFDGGRFIFQGTCVYQFTGLCKKTQDLVDFQVLVQNGQHNNQLLSSIALVKVKVYGKSIVISQKDPNKITVNNQLANLPYHHKRKISVYRSAQDAVVETDFGLTVTYDWQGQVTVVVPGTYADALCGLCGNYNGDVSDDMMMKDGQMTLNPDALGQSWKVADVPGCMELSKEQCPTLLEATKQQEVAEKGCGLISKVDGPFSACHALVDPFKYVQSCVHDFCLFPDQQAVVCQQISHYAATCQAAGVTIGNWRTDDFCSISCPANSHYELCSQSCSQICSSIYTPVKCPERCREDCVCNDGFAFSGDECVPMAQCGCLYQGFYYKLGETFHPTKQEKCQCQDNGSVLCEEVPDTDETECKVVDGVTQCQSDALGTCVVTGDRSYVSFDGLAFEIPGACSYILTETCAGDDSVRSFVVKIEKDSRQKRKVSTIQALSVEVYGLTLTMTRGKTGTVMVDSILYNLPAILNGGQVQVHQHGTGVLLQTNFGLVVHYDLLHHVRVTAPQGYKGHLCGLCGNYNGQQEDDHLLPDGHNAPDVTAFGSAWKTPEVACSDDCSKDDCPECTKEKEEVFQKPNYCGILVVPEGPFSSCYNTINPAPYFHACTRDLCLTEGNTNVLCQSVQSYVATCQDAGVTIEAWRKPSFCPLSCPANSSYSLCTNLCSNSCAGLVDASRCPQKCTEGCRCDEGYTFDGNACVPKDKCGCFVEGIYYKPRESVVQHNCRSSCTCIPGKGVTCESHRCSDDESCEIRDGVLGCINQNPCKALQCRPKETCKFEDGQAKCVPSLVATCWGWGDPHYHTFDGLDFDFQGTCTYTMAESCGSDTRLVPFKVEAKNNVRGGVKSVSYINLANIEVYGQQISIRQKEVGKIRVNGVLTLLPVSLEDGRMELFQSGLTAVLETDFGLRVTYDWNWYLLIELPSSYYKHTCGLCGNFNLKPEDDVPQQGDNLVASIVAWAKGWKVPDDDPFCWDFCEGDCPVCEEEKKELYSGNQYCGLIKKSFQGPFKACHEVVKPGDFFRNCLYDVCMSDGAKSILCKTLEAYASTCKKQGAVVHDWRTPSGCSLPCPENSHYEACGNACPATCTNRDAPSSCTQPCVETCACNPGYVLSGGQCVAVADCGCTRDGRYYQAGEEFWDDETCHSRCRCDPVLGMVVCKEASCKAGEQCAVVKGVRRCVAKGRSICVATGDPHYTTFDGRRYDFMGTCVYQFAALCSEDPTLVPFVVTVENNNRGSRVVSYTKEVTLKVYNMTLSLSQADPQKLKVNGILVDLPFSHGTQLRAYISGVHGFIKTDFDVIVTFDWHSYARVILPSTYARSVCGLCGNADGNPEDDFALPDGTSASDEVQFADAWKVADVPGCTAGCTKDCQVCSEAEKRAYRGDKHCGVLVKKQGPFAACHGAIDPAPYFDDCLFDTCLYKGHQETVCSAVSAYVTACQSQGIRVEPWRTAAFCSPVCPPNQHYELCGSSCPATCGGQMEDEGCDESSPCTEGCFCDPGFLQSGDRCVPLARCGCLHDGRYYQRGEEFYSCPRCTQRCTCKGDGELECEEASCGEGEACTVQEGVRGCYPSSCGRCEVLGAASFRTFDGRALRFAGSCTYTLAAAAEAEGSEVELVPFMVRVQKDHRGPEPLTQQLLITVHGVTISMSQGKQWEVKVDGERHLLPLTLAGGAVTVTQEGAHQVLRAQGGLKLLYDTVSYVLLTLPASYRHHTGGLCGNFDGDAANDAADPEELGSNWGIPVRGCKHGSQPEPCPQSKPELCSLLEDETGPFGGCHKVVAPWEHAASCMQEGCGKAGGVELCRVLQAYAAACQAAGGELQEWREAAKCPLSCPPDSHYELCARTCDQTCASLSAGSSCTSKCFEGCQCDEGFVFNGGECVPMESCGCMHRGRFFEIAETILSADCSERCTCRAAGGMLCQPAGCPFGQVCGTRDGIRGCVEQPGRCTLVPATRFTSFDGATGATMAMGNYVVTSLCKPGHPQWFRLLVDVREVEDRPVVVALHFFGGSSFITIKRDKKIWVNGVPASIPAKISGWLTIFEAKNTT